MNFADLEAFVAVAETGSVNRAAVRLNLTQPATTRRVQNFEASLGSMPLFNRAVKPAVLTVFGSEILTLCRGVLAAVAALEASAAAGGEPSGNLKLGVAHGLGEAVLLTPLDVARQAFPRVRLQILSDWSSALIEGVRSGALDVAIGLLTAAHSLPPTVRAVALGLEQIVIVSAAKPARRPDGTPWRLRDLAGEGWYLNPPGCGCRAALTRACDRLQVDMRLAVEIFGEDLQLAMLARGSGIGLVPRRLLEHSPHRATLRILEVLDFSLAATITLIRPAAAGRFDSILDRLGETLRVDIS